MKDLKLKKLLKQNKGRTFFHKNCSDIFIDISLKANEIKAKTSWTQLNLKTLTQKRKPSIK